LTGWEIARYQIPVKGYQMKTKTLLLLVVVLLNLNANDAEYYTSGNQLVPLEESNVRLDKEVLTIKSLGDYAYSVDVKYRLFNEGEARDTLIGFESTGQIGDAEPEGFFSEKYNDKALLNAEKKAIKTAIKMVENEYISKFKVTVNGKETPYKATDLWNIKKDKYTSPYVGYLYYFPVHLKKGLNTLHHTYHFDGDNSILHYSCEFSYILETAKRWKGGKIKDFTLILDMGENGEFRIFETFFKGTKNWHVEDGFVKHVSEIKDKISYPAYANFYTYSGKAVFHKKNFVPNSVIFLLGTSTNWEIANIVFNLKKDELPFSFVNYITKIAEDERSLKVLKALPYARRGAVFKDKSIGNYYKKYEWYREKINYKKELNSLTKDEKEWLEGIEKVKLKILKNLPYAKRGYSFKDASLSKFFKSKKWYVENENYDANPSDLSEKELVWLEKIEKRKISDRDFFEYIKEYESL